MRGEALKGHLDLLLLAALDPEPAHGYAIIQQLKRRSMESFVLAEGTIYPALHRLEAKGLIESSWAQQDGRRRRLYRLTRQGKNALRQKTRAWWEFAAAMNAALGEAR